DPATHVSTPARASLGRFPHVSKPGSPSRGIVWKRHARLPELTSIALMKQPSAADALRPHPVMPCSTLLPMTMAPLVDGCGISDNGVSHRMSPVRALNATMCALLAGRRILSPEIAMLRMPP